MRPLCAGFSSLAVAIVIAGCASGDQTWRDLHAGGTGPLRSNAQFDADAAQCDYEWRQASAGAPVRPYHSNAQTGVGQALGEVGGAFLQGAPVSLYYACMRPRGWERLS